MYLYYNVVSKQRQLLVIARNAWKILDFEMDATTNGLSTLMMKSFYTEFIEGKKHGQHSRLEIDKVLEYDIQRLGLYVVDAAVNNYGVICYEVIKNKETKLSDLADLAKIGDILDFPIADRRLVDIDLDSEPNVIKGIVYGYPFYTLHPYDYLRDPAEDDLDDEDWDEDD